MNNDNDNNNNNKLNNNLNRSRITRNTTPNRYGTYKNNLEKDNVPLDTVPFNEENNNKSKPNQSIRPTGNLRKEDNIDKVSKTLDKLGPKGKVASKALKTANKAYKKIKEEAPKALQNNNHTPSFYNSKNINNSSEKEETEEEKEKTNDNSYEEDTNKKVKEKGTLSVSLKTKMIIALAVVAFGVLIIIVLLQALLGPISSVLSVFSLDSWFNNEKDYISTQDDPQRQAEIDYNNAIRGSSDGKIKGIVQEYQDKYGVSLDWVMLDTVIQYRYLLANNEDLYSGAGADDISDEDLENRLEELEGSEDGNVDTSSSIDYSNAKKQIKTVASLMIQKIDDYYTSDLEVGGAFYNTLIESNFLKDYYKDYLKDNSYETRKKLVDEIFEQYKFAKEAISKNGMSGIISDNMQIYLQTCEVPYNTTKNERGNTVFSNNRNINKGTNYPQYFSLTDYLKGAVEGELGRGSLTEANKEGVKAFVVATLTYMLGSFYVDFYPGAQTINFPTGNCRLVSCDINNGCSYITDTYGTAYSGLKRFGSSLGQHRPWNEAQKAYMDEVLSEIFGVVMVRPGVTPETFKSGDDLKGGSYSAGCKGNCMDTGDTLADSRNGMTYDQILHKYYSNFDLIDIREGLYYTTTDSFSGQVNLNESFHYHQTNYSQSWCAGGSISASGCSITSAAIAISLLTGQKHDPLDLNKTAESYGNCSSYSSHRNDLIVKLAKSYGLNATQLRKNDPNLNGMLQMLANGHTVVIARMAINNGRYSTTTGHYIALVGAKTEGTTTKVLVWDPVSTSKSRDNYWADFNSDILKYVRSNTDAFMVITNEK